MSLSKRLLILLLTLTLCAAATWGILALHYQLPFGLLVNGGITGLWIALSGYALTLLWRGRLLVAIVLYAVMHGELLLWWNTIQPSHERVWAADVAQLTTGDVKGDHVRLFNVRNFIWHSKTDFKPQWETRDYDLSQLSSVDVITSHWGLASIAHVLVSFGFNDGQFVTFTVEIRKEEHESFSELGGFFKQFELSIIASDEQDAVGVRPNVRGEDSYLYRIAMPAELRRNLFLAYVEQANQLAQTPRFYNTVTVNCTTLVYSIMQQIAGNFPLDARLLLTGYLPEYIAEQDGLMSGYSVAQLREKGRITERSIAAQGQPNYSELIRKDVPGWTLLPSLKP